MKHENLSQLLGLTFVVLVLAACGGRSTAPSESAPSADTPPSPMDTLALPTPGKWGGSAEFGELAFILNPDSTGITQITYNFSGWTCGPTTQSGTIAIGQETGWEGWLVSDGEFVIENNLDPGGNQKMVIAGTFDNTGKQASGKWNAVSHGTSCEGSWEASWSE